MAARPLRLGDQLLPPGPAQGKRDPKYSPEPVRPVLATHLGTEVLFVDDVAGDQARQPLKALGEGQVPLLQNPATSRARSGTTLPWPTGSPPWPRLPDDAFGAAHRAHASVGVAERLPAYAGYLLANEVKVLAAAEDPERAVRGRARGQQGLRTSWPCSTTSSAGSTAWLWVAACASPSWPPRATRSATGCSSPDQVEAVRFLLLETAGSQGKPLLPTDVVVAREVSEDAETRTVPADGIEAGWKGLRHRPGDGQGVTPRRRRPHRVLERAPRWACSGACLLAAGTKAVAEAVVAAAGYTVVGGATSAAALAELGLADRVDHRPPAAGPASSCSRARPCPASPPSRPSEGGPAVARRPLIAGNWKMHKNHLEGVQLTQKLAWALSSEDTDAAEVAVCPLFTALRRRRHPDRRRQAADLPRRPGLTPSPRGLHRRGLGADAGQAGRPVRDRRPLRTPPVLRRGRRAGQPQGQAVLEAGMRPIVCVGEVPRSASRAAPPRSSRARSAAPWPASAATWPAWWSPTSRSGPSAPAAPPPPTTPRRRSPSSSPPSPTWSASRRRGAPHPVRRRRATPRKPAIKPDVDGALVGGASLDADEFAMIIKGSARRAR